MTDFVFTSPGIKFKETDITFVTRNVGITTLGLVGETLKGPAFEPVFIQDKTEFQKRFGSKSTKKFSNGLLQYQLPYAADSYLSESNQLYVTRVLGLSGYNAGKAWALTLNAGLDPATVSSGASTTYSANFTESSYMGVTLTNTGDTGVNFSGFVKYNATSFSGTSYSFIVTGYTGSTGNGIVSVTATTFNGTEYTSYKNMVLGLIRSRGTVTPVRNAAPVYTYNTNTLSITGNTTNLGLGNLFGTFNIQTVGTSQNDIYKLSLNYNSTSYISNIIGNEQSGKDSMIFAEAFYPNLIQKINYDGNTFSDTLSSYGISGVSPFGYGVNSDLIECTSDFFTDYNVPFQTPETPWVVSEIKGNKVDRLFKFISISDGNSANQEIKISITNINLENYEFDVIIRDFYDTDDNVIILETYNKCSLNESENSYIARKIGDKMGNFTLNSKYVMIEMAADINPEDFPCGFEGYQLNNYAASATTSGITNTIPGITPKIFYKQSYNVNDKVKKVYLGISETGYNTEDNVEVGFNQNLFNFNGQIKEGSHVKSNGFHLDIEASGVTSNGYSFDTGAGKIQTYEDVSDNTATYYSISSRKFTFVPSRGFDGWNVYRTTRSYHDEYKQNGIFDGVLPNQLALNDFQAWELAINTFANPDEITINLFATPGINWKDQTELVKNTIEMIETQRTDSLYIIDSPDIDVTMAVGDNGRADIIASEELVDYLKTTDIDTSYACTYFPWIQIKDTQNNINVYIPPTGEITKAFAYTDDKAFPWFATAGLERGALSAKKSKYKLSTPAKDTLYAGRINPIIDYPETGTAVMGQKTLQIKASKLDRINVRRLILRLKVILSNIAIRLLFDPNDTTLIDRFKEKANPALDSVVSNRGLDDYYFKMDSQLNTPETRDRNELYGQLFIKPVSAVEFIGIEFVITPTGASFKI